MILVAGGTGSLGSRIVYRLLERGESVRVLARSTSAYEPLQKAGAEVAIGDLTDSASLERACRGAAAVITTASVSKTGTDTIENVDLRGNQNLIVAARGSRVEQFVFVSTLGASPESPLPVFRAKGIAEARLRESGMAYTVLQPNAFMDVWFGMLIEGPAFSGQPITLVGEARRRHSFVAEQDVAEFAVAALRTAAGRRATIAIGGPEALSWRDVVAAYEQASERTLPLRFVAPGDPIPGLPEPVWGLAAALETFDSPIPMDDTAATYGIELTSVSTFARSRVRQVGGTSS